MNYITTYTHGRLLVAENDQHDFNYNSSLVSLVEQGDVVVEVGAHIGATTVGFAKAVGHDGVVVAIEAQQLLYHMLCGNIALNNLRNVVAFQRVVADKSNEIYYVPAYEQDEELDFGDTSLYNQSKLRKMSYGGRSVPCATVALDDMRLARVNLLFIDAPNMALATLKGAEKTLSRYHPRIIINTSEPSDKLVDHLRERGYVMRIEDGRLIAEHGVSEDCISL